MLFRQSAHCDTDALMLVTHLVNDAKNDLFPCYRKLNCLKFHLLVILY